MENIESKQYSWRWLTGSGPLSHGPCELCYAMITSAAAASAATLYDGESATGDIIAILEGPATISQQMHFMAPIFCNKGLYVALDQNVTGVLVQWRELSNEEKGG